MDEPELLNQIRQYLFAVIEDKEAFVASILSELTKQSVRSADPEQMEREREVKRKKLLAKKERYQEMYANDLICMKELKDKLAVIAEERKTLDLEQTAQSAENLNNAEQINQYYRQQILRFLELETVTNMDMRRIIDHISVNKNGNVRVVLKKFEEIAA